ncbi:helix-turn-helix domain-containing protein [Streptomyces sp. NPDC014734]|uniref:helix-turn-helix domain-containing protein n=1 Tax=Streptomyces sp. NPDC014734 TaxID=3364886 RepID=UPI0036FFCDA0
MGRPETCIDPSEGPLQSFAYELRTLRRSAGNPSYRELASRANYSGTTLSEAARGVSLPSLEVTLAYVKACKGDVGLWQRLWTETDAALRADDTSDFQASEALSEPVARGARFRPVGAFPPVGRGICGPNLLRTALPALAGIAGVAGAAGLVGRRPGATALTFVAGTCVVSAFWLGRNLKDA